MSLVSGPGRGGMGDEESLQEGPRRELCTEQHVRYVQELDKVLDIRNCPLNMLIAERGKTSLSTG